MLCRMDYVFGCVATIYETNLYYINSETELLAEETESIQTMFI